MLIGCFPCLTFGDIACCQAEDEAVLRYGVGSQLGNLDVAQAECTEDQALGYVPAAPQAVGTALRHLTLKWFLWCSAIALPFVRLVLCAC